MRKNGRWTFDLYRLCLEPKLTRCRVCSCYRSLKLMFFGIWWLGVGCKPWSWLTFTKLGTVDSFDSLVDSEDSNKLLNLVCWWLYKTVINSSTEMISNEINFDLIISFLSYSNMKNAFPPLPNAAIFYPFFSF